MQGGGKPRAPRGRLFFSNDLREGKGYPGLRDSKIEPQPPPTPQLPRLALASLSE